MLSTYAELAVRVALNLQPGQRLLLLGPLAYGGVSLEAAVLVRQVVESAYKAGARLVEVLWGDEALQLARFAHAPRDSFEEFSAWMPGALVEHVDRGHAVLSIYANDPDLLSHEPADLVGAMQQATFRSVNAFRERISRNQTNWAVIAGPNAKWAAKVFPDLPAERRLASLWDTIAQLCRLHAPDPAAAWQAHIEALAARSERLNRKRYAELRYTGPGTALTIGLPEGHIWISARTVSRSGIPFTANLPTEEVFTMPHRDRVDGVVGSTRPLSHGGTLIDRFTLRFVEGQVVEARAERGEAILRRLLETDPGARRLGEIALVPASSLVSASGLLFYSTLFDENAASHVALGSAYKFTMDRGDSMDDAAFERAGGNRSAVHVDFMIGSPELDVDGILPGGRVEPVMRQGEWID
jgi:aminopeptidase